MRSNLKTLTPIRTVLSTVVALAIVLVVASSASALGTPAYKVFAIAPDSIPTGEEPTLTIAIENVGDTTTSGPITVVDTLSPGLTAPAPSLYEEASAGTGPLVCETVGLTLTCTVDSPLPPGAQFSVFFKTRIEATAGLVTGDVTVSGGGVVEPVHEQQRMIAGPAGPFDFTVGEVHLNSVDGSEATQAGSNPAEYTTTLRWRSFASRYNANGIIRNEFPSAASVEFFKDVTAHLPPGLIGNPSATPSVCTPDQLAQFACPADSQIGVVKIYLNQGDAVKSLITGLFNMVAPHGVATEIGFDYYGSVVLLQAHVRPSDYGVDIVSRDTTTSAPVLRVDVTVWGVPSDQSHDRYRFACLEAKTFTGSNGSVCPSSAPRKAFLRLPTGCSGKPLAFGAESNSYEHLDHFASVSFDGPTLDGCDAVPFKPSLLVDPTGTAANSPTGVNVKLSVPQSNAPDGLAQADLKKAVVTLPEGMAINPSGADGLAACDDEHLKLGSTAPADCPDGSKIGTLVVHTQLISNPIEGTIYLRTQNSSDPASGEMFRMAIELRDDSHGLDFKVPGRISANPVTGRLTTTFDDNPQFPFEDITLKFKSGARAPLVTPASCETQTTEANLYPYSAPDRPVVRSSSFTLTSGPEGTACVDRQPFNPGFDAGVSSVQAGGFTSFLTTFKRSDADQSMQRVSVKLPLGLSGSLDGLPLCPEPQASAGTCSTASEIGSATSGAGAGPTPFYVTGGKVFMTGPYEGAPFGLSVVVPAKAGPFDLGTVVVRAKVEVDLYTAQLTVTTDPLPQIVGGVPVNLRLVNVTINRPGFTFNPTSCNPTNVTGTMTGGQGAVANLSNHFQVTNCGALSFKPQFKVSVSGKTSRASGASLDAKLAYPKNIGQSNIAKVKVSLPKQLPSRLTTLQKACTAQTFDTNPAACPVASRIGTATANTPILPVPLTGPVYFVSHGGEAFPDLVVVLQGYGVTVNLVGTTFISKTGITSTTFKTVPDVPVGTFELKLPQGRYSALAANGNLCKTKLAMPTAFIAQDGARINQTTPIVVSGCAKHKTNKAKAKKANRGKANAKKGNRK